MRDFRERPEFKFGNSGERLVANWLKNNDVYVIPSYDYSGDDGAKAPRLQGLVRSYVIPDLDTAKSGVRRWVEVKTKSRPDLSRVTNTWDHGIEERLLLNYQTVQEITGTEAWVCIYEHEACKVLLAPVDYVLTEMAREPKRRRRMNDGKIGIYIDRELFTDHDPYGPIPPRLFTPKPPTLYVPPRRRPRGECDGQLGLGEAG